MSKADREAAPSLVTTTENPTKSKEAESAAETEESESDWGPQQRRTFQRSMTLLQHWESRGCDIVWFMLSSSPSSKPAGELAYSFQRLVQRIERAKIAYCDGEHCPKHDEPYPHRMDHIDGLENLKVRTSEGPQGVLHGFLALDTRWMRESHQQRGLWIPQNWLSDQWQEIHGGEIGVPDETARELLNGEATPKERAQLVEELHDEAGPGYVWIEKYGEKDGHEAGKVAGYLASQYLGEHGEALEHISYSHGRSLGGPIKATWKKIVKHTESIDRAVEVWQRVLAREYVEIVREKKYTRSVMKVKPPPELGVESVEGELIQPPPAD